MTISYGSNGHIATCVAKIGSNVLTYTFNYKTDVTTTLKSVDVVSGNGMKGTTSIDTYDGSKPLTFKNFDGESITLTYYTDGSLATSKTPDATITYSYDTNASRHNPYANMGLYELFVIAGEYTKLTDKLVESAGGDVFWYTYNSDGYPVSITHGTAIKTTLTY